jgi:hypothetical protein
LFDRGAFNETLIRFGEHGLHNSQNVNIIACPREIQRKMQRSA